MNLFNTFKGKQRTGMIGAIFAVVTTIQSLRTLKNYVGTRTKRK